MANRGMLPKFRPATLGGRDGARPSIRPVALGKPSAPPPPPSPPRRVPSGIRNPVVNPHGPAIEGHADLGSQTPSFADPPTMAAARQRVHEIARELPRENDYGMPRFDDETQARPLDDHRNAMAAYGAPPAPVAAPMNVAYDSLPSLEGARPYDRFEEEFEEHDPSTAFRGPHNHQESPYDHQDDQHDQHDEEAEYSTRGFANPPVARDEQPPGSYSYNNGNRYNDHHDDNEDRSAAYSEPPPAQASPYNRTAAFGGMDRQVDSRDHSEDSGPRQRERKNAGAIPQYDAAAYEANYGRREGSIQRRNPTPAPQKITDYAPETARVEERAPQQHGSYKAPPRSTPRPVEEQYEAPQAHQSYQRTRKESSERVREREPVEQMIPQAPRVPQEFGPPAAIAATQAAMPNDNMKVPAGFVMGVQPIRTPGSGAPAAAHAGHQQAYSGASAIDQFPPAFPQPVRTPHMGIPPYGQVHQHHQIAGQQYVPGQHPGQMMSPRAMHGAGPGPGMGMPHMHIRPPTTNAPVGHQLQMTEVEEAQQGSKVGRFAWFVFGAAFGIFFAFFATGFVPRLGKKEEISFPTPPAIPTQQQQVAPVVQPPPPPVQVAQIPVAPPPVAQQPAPPVQAAPQAPAPQAPPPAFAQPQPYGGVLAASPAAPPPSPAAAPQKFEHAPAPAAAPAAARGQRAGTIASRGPTRPAAPPPAPRRAAADDDDAPAPAAKKSAGVDDAAGLLSAGL